MAHRPEGPAAAVDALRLPRSLESRRHARRIHDALYAKCRQAAAREASPTAAIIDSQSVKSAEKRGACIDPAGYDAGKKIMGKKRHILVDTQGLLMHAIVHAADIQDRDDCRSGRIEAHRDYLLGLIRRRNKLNVWFPEPIGDCNGSLFTALLAIVIVAKTFRRPRPVLVGT